MIQTFDAGELIAKSKRINFTDPVERMGYVLSTVERIRPPQQGGYAYVTQYKHGRIDVNIYKIVDPNEVPSAKLLSEYAVMDTPEGMYRVDPGEMELWVKARPKRAFSIQLH